MERIRVIDADAHGLRHTGHKAEIKLRKDMQPEPLNPGGRQLASPRKCSSGNESRRFKDGLKHTIDWYFQTKDREEVKRIFARMLTER